MAGIGVVDYLTGPRWGFSLFYLMPIVAVGWRFGRLPAALIAAAAAVSWFLAELAWYEDVAPTLWNGFTRFVMYEAIGQLTALVRIDRDELSSVVTRESQSAPDRSADRPAQPPWPPGPVGRGARAEPARPQPGRAAVSRVDNVKQVNDRHGHAKGDELLVEIGGLLTANLRAHDVAARLGGDEFAVLLAGADRGVAEMVAQRLMAAFPHVAVHYPGTELGCSIGVTLFRDPPADVEGMLHAADAAMYRAKHAGKHRVVFEEHASGKPGP